MTWLILIPAFALPTFCGYMFVSLLLGGRSRGFPEKLFLGFGAGLGLMSLEVFLMGVASITYSAASITAALSALAILLVIIRFFLPLGGASPPTAPVSAPLFRGGSNPLLMLLAAALIAWMAWKIGFTLYEGFTRPITHQDSWENWSGGAKFFYFSRSLMLDAANKHFFGRGYRTFIGYPLLNPLSQLWTSYALSTFHESLAKAWAPLYFISILGVLFSTLRKKAGSLGALIATFFLSSAPLFTYHSFSAYSDLPLSFYVLSGSVLLWTYMEGRKGNGEGGGRTLALSGIFFAMGAFTKTEGFVYLGAAGLALLAYNLIEKEHRWRDLLYFIIPAALYIAPWIIFKAYYGIGYGHGSELGRSDIASSIPITSELHFNAIGIFLKELLLTVNHAMVFPFLILAALIAPGKFIGSSVKYIYLIIACVASVFIFVYITTFDYVYMLNRNTPNRNILTFVPLAFLAAGLMAAKLLDRE